MSDTDARPHGLRRISDRADASAGWGSQALWETMSPHWPGMTVEVVESIDSTNTALVERFREIARNASGRGTRAGDLNACLLIAARQTQGRGRMGRTWHASPDCSLTFSLAVPLRHALWSGLSLAVGVALARALDPAGQSLRLKWPNDLWLVGQGQPGRKLGGVLIEGLAVGDHRVAVIGVGLNVRRQSHINALSSVADLSELDWQATPARVMAAVGPELARAVAEFDREGFAAFEAEFAARDLLAGQPIVSTDPACPDGVALGVAEDGALRVLRAGTEHRILSGEVSVRPVTRNATPLPP